MSGEGQGEVVGMKYEGKPAEEELLSIKYPTPAEDIEIFDILGTKLV